MQLAVEQNATEKSGQVNLKRRKDEKNGGIMKLIDRPFENKNKNILKLLLTESKLQNCVQTSEYQW